MPCPPPQKFFLGASCWFAVWNRLTGSLYDFHILDGYLFLGITSVVMPYASLVDVMGVIRRVTW